MTIELIEAMAQEWPDTGELFSVEIFADWLKEKMAGYRLVPVEPTEAMETANAMYGDTSDWWNAVLAAAPDHSEQVRPMASPWVPVSERLPPIGDSVLVYTPRSDRVCERMRLIPHEGSPGYYWGDRFGTAHTLARFVTHWMPLPAPPDHVAGASKKEVGRD